MKLNTLSSRSQFLFLLAAILITRLGLAWVFGGEVADLSQYHWMSDIISRGENIYETEGLFHYTPIPMFLPDWSMQTAQALGLPFHFVVKWPMILADAGIALLLWWQARRRGLKGWALLLGLGYAFNPVSLLTTAFHGSYSVLPAFFSLLAYCLATLDPGRRFYRFSALSLGMAIGLRGYPVLYLPFFLRKMNLDWRRKVGFVVLAGLPSLITFIPFLLANFQAIWRDVFSYSGVADYGLIAIARGYWFLTTHNFYLPGTLGDDLVEVSKRLFLVAYVVLVINFWKKPQRFSLLSGILGTLLLFLGIYGGISSQYLIWVIPFALLVRSGWEKAYTWTAAASLVFFYLFYFPTVLFGDLPVLWPDSNPIVMVFRLISALAFWGVSLAWLAQILRSPPPDLSLGVSGLANSSSTQPVEGDKNTPGKQRKIWSWALAGEISMVAYTGLILWMGVRTLIPAASGVAVEPTRVEAQRVQAELVWAVGKNGSGLGELAAPLDLTVDPQGNIYIADRGNHRVQKFSPDGTPADEWAGDDLGEHPFVEPSGVAVDPGSELVWVVDSGSGWIYRLEPDGKLEAAIDGSALGLYNPRGLAIDSSGDLFVADTGGARILRLDPMGKLLATWGEVGTKTGQFQEPTGMAIHGNNLFVADVSNRRVVHSDLDGKWIGSWATEEGSAWIAVDDSGRVFVSSSHNAEVSIYDVDGNLLGVLRPEEEIDYIEGLTGIAAAQDGWIYIVGSSKLYHYKVVWNMIAP